MLDQQLKEQLQSVFAQLENEVTFLIQESNNQDQAELVEMLKDISDTSAKIKLKFVTAHRQNKSPEFSIEYQGKMNGITFKGIPNGHEFTSLILAILNSDQKGKMPDQAMIQKIKNIKGPVHIQTFVSLTCENCPDVVQALNLMAVIHGNFHHEMLDGQYFQDEINQLGIQGVPSLVVNNKMIHSGRITLLDLVNKLEQIFGKQSENIQLANSDLGEVDVAVIGGGPAGASAAIYTVRKGLKTALITEKIGGQVQETRGIENLISVTYTEGPKLAGQLAEHVASYPIQVLENRRVKSMTKDQTKLITFESGETLKAKSVIIATGARWRELGVPGEKQYMGSGVAYCPHCDGPFYKGKKVAVIGGGNSGVEAAIDLAGIVNEVVLFEYNDTLRADQILVDKLKSLSNTSIITNAQTKEIKGNGQKVNAIEYLDRQTNEMKSVNLDGIFIQIGLVPNSQFAKDLVEMTKFGEIIVDHKCRTNVPGIYAAGDVTTVPYKQIVIAMGEGAKAGLSAFEDQIYGH